MTTVSEGHKCGSGSVGWPRVWVSHEVAVRLQVGIDEIPCVFEIIKKNLNKGKSLEINYC